MLRQSIASTTMSTINISGLALPRLSFGLGSLMKWAPNHAYPLPTDSTLEVRQALAAGFRHFNTGDLYTNNASAAAALRESGLKREEVFLSLKVNTFASLGCGGREDMRGKVRGEVERFGGMGGGVGGGKGYVDVLLLHFPPRGYVGNLSNREAWRVVEELKDEGVARVVGVSNW
jgi:diketogulonate reductase-like aldo/keto reductase